MTMKIILSISALLFLNGCVAPVEDKVVEIDYKKELEVAVAAFKEATYPQVVGLSNEVDSIVEIIQAVDYNELNYLDTVTCERLEITLNHYRTNKSATETNAILVFDNTYMTEVVSQMRSEAFNINDFTSGAEYGRADTLSFIAQFQDRLIALNKTLTNQNSTYARDELLYNQFNNLDINFRTWLFANYTIVVKNYLYIKPRAMYGSFDPGRIISGVFVYDKSQHKIVDQFKLMVINSPEVMYKEDDDYETQLANFQDKLESDLKYKFQVALNEYLKVRYTLEGDDVYLTIPEN